METCCRAQQRELAENREPRLACTVDLRGKIRGGHARISRRFKVRTYLGMFFPDPDRDTQGHHRTSRDIPGARPLPTSPTLWGLRDIAERCLTHIHGNSASDPPAPSLYCSHLAPLTAVSRACCCI